ncbi:hypothetical protein GWG54_03690 [Natronococcus sp. JC468]|uniref:hypothetical protein n=1 Tax=Natronococcus sp. JC468 TaxID=1961921 RepID=UPI00143AE345|nr:hypothetical protein [Natronococcus sp. JC468]NKE34931.1 hypothetical protein [Natronococcus sp. JC468]
MSESIPPQCPECDSSNLKLSRVAPAEHERGEEWVTHVSCESCSEYTEWYE